MSELHVLDIDNYGELMIGKQVGDIIITQIIRIDCIHGHVYVMGIDVDKIVEY